MAAYANLENDAIELQKNDSLEHTEEDKTKNTTPMSNKRKKQITFCFIFVAVCGVAAILTIILVLYRDHGTIPTVKDAAKCDLSKNCSGFGYPIKTVKVGSAPSFVTSSADKILIAHQTGVSILSADFTVESEFGKSGSDDGEFDHAYGLSVWENKEVFVSDNKNNRINVFSINGTYIRKFGSFGSGPGQLNGPTGNAIYDGKLYVADVRNDRISVYNLNGTFVEGLGPFDRPNAVLFTSRGEMIVVQTQAYRTKIYVVKNDVVTILNETANSQIGIDGAGNVLISDWSAHPDHIVIHDRNFVHLCNVPFPYAPHGVYVTKDCDVVLTDFYQGRVVLYRPMS